MTLGQFGSTIVKILIMVGFLFNAGAAPHVGRPPPERDDPGPHRPEPRGRQSLRQVELRLAGLLHTAADGVKFFFKEDFIPPNADKLLFGLAPILAMVPVLALIAVIPFGDTVAIA